MPILTGYLYKREKYKKEIISKLLKMNITNPSKAQKLSELINRSDIESYKWIPDLINDKILKPVEIIENKIHIPTILGEKETEYLSNLKIYLDPNNLEKYIKNTKLKAGLILLTYLLLPYTLSWIGYINNRIQYPLWKYPILVNLITITITFFAWIITSIHYITWFSFKKHIQKTLKK